MGPQGLGLQSLQCWSSLSRGDGQCQAQGASFSVCSGGGGDGKESQNAGFVSVPLRGGLSQHEPAFP